MNVVEMERKLKILNLELKPQGKGFKVVSTLITWERSFNTFPEVESYINSQYSEHVYMMKH